MYSQEESFINISDIINRIKARIGASVRGLELSDYHLSELLTNESLKTLSIYFPQIIPHVIDADEDIVDKTGNTNLFYLKTSYPVIGVSDVIDIGYLDYTNNALYHRLMTNPSDIMMSYLTKELLDANTLPTTATFIPPNMVSIHPYNDLHRKIVLKLKVPHQSFNTLHAGLREKVFKLCEYDVKLDILGIRKYFNSLSTPFADIELNLGSFEDAESKRDELIQLFRINQHKSANRKKLWVG